MNLWFRKESECLKSELTPLFFTAMTTRGTVGTSSAVDFAAFEADPACL